MDRDVLPLQDHLGLGVEQRRRIVMCQIEHGGARRLLQRQRHLALRSLQHAAHDGERDRIDLGVALGPHASLPFRNMAWAGRNLPSSFQRFACFQARSEDRRASATFRISAGMKGMRPAATAFSAPISIASQPVPSAKIATSPMANMSECGDNVAPEAPVGEIADDHRRQQEARKIAARRACHIGKPRARREDRRTDGAQRQPGEHGRPAEPCAPRWRRSSARPASAASSAPARRAPAPWRRVSAAPRRGRRHRLVQQLGLAARPSRSRLPFMCYVPSD